MRSISAGSAISRDISEEIGASFSTAISDSATLKCPKSDPACWSSTACGVVSAKAA
jgi:hypothetical protein